MSDLNVSAEQLIFFGLALAGLPLLLATATCYIKIGIIIGVLRNAFGVQGVPGRMAEFALSFALTALVMGPVAQSMYELAQKAPKPVVGTQGLDLATVEELVMPWIEFLQRNTGSREVAFVASLRTSAVETAEPKSQADRFVWDSVLPAFVLSELRKGFEMGFSILLPFLVVDLVVANILAGIGLNMLSPTLVAFPLKILLFVACDGWMMITRGILISYEIV